MGPDPQIGSRGFMSGRQTSKCPRSRLFIVLLLYEQTAPALRCVNVLRRVEHECVSISDTVVHMLRSTQPGTNHDSRGDTLLNTNSNHPGVYVWLHCGDSNNVILVCAPEGGGQVQGWQPWLVCGPEPRRLVFPLSGPADSTGAHSEPCFTPTARCNWSPGSSSFSLHALYFLGSSVI